MFQLKRDKYIAALESAEALEKTLREEIENLGISSKNLSENWQGAQAERSLTAINVSLEVSNHAKALGYTQGMTSIMGEYLPEIEKLMAKREQIGKQLKQDKYVEPDLTSFYENELIVNYDYIDDIKADVEGALLYGDNAIEILEEMIADVEECAGEYVNLTHVQELLDEGKKKLHRLENYRDEFVDFGKKMSDLEYNMSMDLANVMRVQGDIFSSSNAMVTINVDQGIRIEEIEKYDEELEKYKLLKEIEEEYGKEISEKVAEMLEKDSEGKYSFENFMDEDFTKLSETDIEALACLYEELYRNIENAKSENECQYEIMMAEHFSKGLLGGELQSDTTVGFYGATTVLQFSVVSKDGLIEELLSRMGEENGRSLGYNYLLQIYGTNFLAGEKILGKDDDVRNFYEQPAVQISINFNDDGIGIDYSMEYYPVMENIVKYVESADYYMSGYEKALQYVEGLHSDLYANLLELGYKKEDIAAMFTMAHNAEDVSLVVNLMAGNEADIFKVVPEMYSNEMKSVLASYAIKLGMADIEQDNGYKRLEEFTNLMLSPDNGYSQVKEYMELMSVYCGLERDAVVVAMWNSDGIDYNLINTMENVDAITSFFQTLYLQGAEERESFVFSTYQLLQLHIQNLEITENEVSYDIIGYLKKPDETGTSIWHICAQTHWDPLEANSDIFVKEMIEIDNQIEGLWTSYAADAFICTASLVDKNVGLSLKILKAAHEGNIKTTENSVTRIKVNGKGLSESILCVADVFGIYADYRKKKDSLQRNWEEQVNNSVIAWFYSGNVYWVNSSAPNYYNTGIYNGYVIEAIKEWDAEGLASFFQGETLDDVRKEEVADIASKLLCVNEEGVVINTDGCRNLNLLEEYDENCKKEAMLFLIYGNKGMTIEGETYTSNYKSIIDIPVEVFLVCIQDINEMITNNQGNRSIEKQWQNKIEDLME